MGDYNVWAAWNSLINKALKVTNDPNFVSTLKLFQRSAVLPKLNTNDGEFNGQYDWAALKQAADKTSHGAYVFDLLKSLGLAQTPFDKPTLVKNFILGDPKLKSALGDLKVTWNPQTRTIMLNGKPFLTQDKFTIVNGHAVTNPDVLQDAIKTYLKNSISVDNGDNTTDKTVDDKTNIADMSNTDLQYYINKFAKEGQLNSYQDALKVVGDDEDAISKKITDTFDSLTKSALADLEEKYNTQKSALESEKGEVAAHYAGALKEVDNAVKTAKASSKESMAARGIYFSGLMSKAINTIEAQGILQKSKIEAAKTADLNKISSALAVLTSNYAIGQSKIKDYYAAQKGLKLLDLMERDAQMKQQIKIAMAGVKAQIDTLEKQKPYLEEIGKRQEQAAQQQAEQDYYFKMDKSNQAWAKINQQWAKLQEDDNHFWATYGLNKDKLMENSYEFAKTMQLNQNKFDLDKWYKEQQIAIQSALANSKIAKNMSTQQKQSAQQILNTPLSKLVTMTPSDLLKFIKSTESLKVLADPKNPFSKKDFPAGFEPVKKMEGFALTLYDLASNSGNLSNPKTLATFKNDLNTISKFNLKGNEINSLINYYVQDPIGKVFAQLYLRGGGDLEKMRYIYYNEANNINKILSQYGANDSDHLKLLYDLLQIGGGHH